MAQDAAPPEDVRHHFVSPNDLLYASLLTSPTSYRARMAAARRGDLDYRSERLHAIDSASPTTRPPVEGHLTQRLILVVQLKGIEMRGRAGFAVAC